MQNLLQHAGDKPDKGVAKAVIKNENASILPTREKLSEIFARYYAYFEEILNEANAQGQAAIDDVPRKAKSLFAFFEGMQMLAHTHNNPALITEMTPDVRALVAA